MPHCVSAASEDTLGATGKFSSLTRSHPGMTHLLRVVMLAVCNNLPWIFMEKHRLEFVPSVHVRVCVSASAPFLFEGFNSVHIWQT